MIRLSPFNVEVLQRQAIGKGKFFNYLNEIPFLIVILDKMARTMMEWTKTIIFLNPNKPVK